ncbi:MAG: histidine kinase, partial [Ginsengibacter sp.]
SINKKQYDSAFYYFHLFENYAQTAGAGPLSKLYTGLGELHLKLKNFDTALVNLNQALNIIKKARDKNQVMRILLPLSTTYKEKGNYAQAIKIANELLEMANENGARQFIRDAHFMLYGLFEHLEKVDSAYYHLRQYTIIKDSIDLNLTAQKLQFYKIKEQNEKAQASINILNDEKKLQQQRLKETAKQRKILLTGIVVLLLLGSLVIRNISLKRNSERNQRQLAENELKLQKSESEKKLAEFQQQATDLQMQALRAQMNPHFIFNCLNAINGFILINESEAAAGYLTKFSRLIRMVLKNSQKKFISLSEELETLNLYLYMESLRFKDNFTYLIKCDDTIDTLSIFIPPLLLQPFAENAIWHGLAHKQEDRELLIELHVEENILHCTITDNGVGREKAASLKSKSAEKNKSLGLQITRNRMKLLNNNLNGQPFFEINDLKDEWGNAAGTRVHLRIKIKETNEENVSEDVIQKLS